MLNIKLFDMIDYTPLLKFIKLILIKGKIVYFINKWLLL